MKKIKEDVSWKENKNRTCFKLRKIAAGVLSAAFLVGMGAAGSDMKSVMEYKPSTWQ